MDLSEWGANVGEEARKNFNVWLQNGFYEPRYLPFEVLAYPSRVLPYHLHRVLSLIHI